MYKKISTLLLLCTFSFCHGFAQTLETKVSKNASAPSEEVSPTQMKGDGIKLNPSNKYNVAPKDVEKWLNANHHNSSSISSPIGGGESTYRSIH